MISAVQITQYTTGESRINSRVFGLIQAPVHRGARGWGRLERPVRRPARSRAGAVVGEGVVGEGDRVDPDPRAEPGVRREVEPEVVT